MARRWVPLLVGLSFSVTALGEPYWIAWEGDDFPENQGWERNWGNWDGQYEGDGAIRTLEDGILTYDSLFDDGVFDFSFMECPGQIDPEPGELFVMEWGLEVEEVVGHSDPSVSFWSNEAWRLGFAYSEDHIWSVFENATVPIEAGVFHAYRVVSADMRTYELFVDGELAHSGVLTQGFAQSYVGWGDGAQGAASLHCWDYFRFGVVPEPASVWLLGSLVCCVCRRA